MVSNCPTRKYMFHECTLEELHLWLIDNEPGVARRFKELGTSAQEILASIRHFPGIGKARNAWQNQRPFPSDTQLALMLIVFCPVEKRKGFDDADLETINLALHLMALPDPGPSAVRVNIPRRAFRLDRRVVTMVEC